MDTENRYEERRPDRWPGLVFLVFFLVVVGGIVLALRMGGGRGEKPVVPDAAGAVGGESVAAPAPTSVLTEEQVHPEKQYPAPHGVVVAPPPPPVPVVTARPEVTVTHPPVVVVTARPTVAPVSYTLNLRMTNPDYGTVSVEPYSPGNQYAQGTRVTLAAKAKAGYKFGGWRGDVTGVQESLVVVMDRNKAVSGEFSRGSYALDIDPGLTGGSVVLTPNLRNFESGAVVKVEAKPAPGYIFQSWSGDASGRENPVTVTVDGDKKIGASFVKGQYTLSVKVNPAGLIEASPPGGYQDGGTKVTLTAKPLAGYRFGSWSGDATGKDATVTVTMDSNKNITANFIRVYTLNVFVYPPGYGTVTPSLGEYDDGTEVTLTATPSSSTEFVEWSGHVTGTSQILRLVMNSDKSVGAHFQAVKYPSFQ